MSTIIIAAVAALAFIVGFGSNLFLKSDNKVEEASEEVIGAISGVKPDLSPWNGDPDDGLNGPSKLDSKEKPADEVIIDLSRKKVVYIMHESCNGPCENDAKYQELPTDPILVTCPQLAFEDLNGPGVKDAGAAANSQDRDRRIFA